MTVSDVEVGGEFVIKCGCSFRRDPHLPSSKDQVRLPPYQIWVRRHSACDRHTYPGSASPLWVINLDVQVDAFLTLLLQNFASEPSPESTETITVQ